ncbi:Glucose/arabinose dehydrogenase, beta-propeller fold [Catalinimonas alkaloidigena]|uniref:Glucose/arabinose dehydrogenase, beta-propeller fold n=1 Tax=Catalinimonas alkaloidigena TaxID=1075417 RepID=A0A1G8WSH5_9BACT|nr:hypothetical protein [Catalinimonas alkaloidigena]SDJ80585.1 Glucose/arabinose dehydrogenase, beta-propeller fold [Catalinimonas alkaloidigena]
MMLLLTLWLGLTTPPTSVPGDSIQDYYRLETVPTPAGLVAETGGVGFMPDGRLVACYHRGEVMTYDPATDTWKLFAEGLHDPLGILPVSNDEVLIMQRPELTRVRDTDGDGVADVYETVTDDFGMSGNYHEFAFGPEPDGHGNLFIGLNTASNGAGIRDEIRGTFNPLGRPGRMYSCVPYRGWVMKLTPDGNLEPFALGFRSPNTLGFDGEGRLFVADNQGDWLGTSKLYHVEKDKFYGHVASLVWKPSWNVDPLTLPVATLDSLRTRAAVLFPHAIMASSPTQPILIKDDRFGPFQGQMLIGEMNVPRIIRLMLEEVDGQMQGACVPFYDGAGLRKGNNRLVFGPDGSLWVGQNDHGWAGDEGLQHLTWTGDVPLEIKTMHVTKKGFELEFTRPVDKATARRPEAYPFQRYYYEYHRDYGSDQFDKQAVPVTNVKVSKDGRKVTLTLAEMVPGYVYQLDAEGIKGTDGTRLVNTLVCYTLNRLKK